MSRTAFAVLLLAMFISTPQVHGNDVLSEQFRDTLLRLAQDGRLKHLDAPLVMERSAERVANLGLLVDRDDTRGLLVLGTLPGGSAEAIGLQAGDRLLEANSIDLRGTGAGDRMRRLVDIWDDGDELQVKVVRDGQELALAGPMQILRLPSLRIELGAMAVEGRMPGDAESSCARISTFPAAPRGQNLFPIRVLAIDGRGSGELSQDTFRIPVGRVTVRLSERIDTRHFSPSANSQRGRRGGDVHHEIVIDTKPGVTYFLAAQFFPNRADRIVDGQYWQPVVWKERGESCR